MSTIKKYLQTMLLNYKGILYFILILAVTHFVWKLTVTGDETDTIVKFLWLDISKPFNQAAAHVAQTITKVLTLAGYDINLEPLNTIRHSNGNAVRIVWSCTGIKQIFILSSILLCYKGPFKHKLWYLPLGIILAYFFNIFRISFITAAVKTNPELLQLLHEHIFKYLYYLIIFAIWVFWEEKFVRQKQH